MTRVAGRIWKASDLEQLTPAEQDELFRSSIVLDLADAPHELVERSRRRLQDRIDRAELPKQV